MSLSFQANAKNRKKLSFQKHLQLGGRHSSVVSSAPTILQPGFESQAHHLCFFSICIEIVTRKERK